MYQLARQVKFKTKIELLKQRPIPLLISILLFGFTILFITISMLFISAFTDNSNTTVDYTAIKERGKLTAGKIISIEIQDNITYNGQHPAIIRYTYRNENQVIESKYRLLSPDSIGSMKVGDNIQIKYWGTTSIINGFEPFSFPVEIFVLAPLPFLIIGILMSIYVVIMFVRELHLYQFGKVYTAELISMMPISGMPITSSGQRIHVYYKYKTSDGQNILGESLTTDFSILNDKKQGEEIKIFVSETDESKSCLIPKIEAIRNDWKIEAKR